MASSYHTRIVTVTADADPLKALKELDEALAEEEGKEYELHSVTPLTPLTAAGEPPGSYIPKLLVVTKYKPKEKPKDA